jgi:brefeldin A-inhibited guanine nucleotide-exchange protein
MPSLLPHFSNVAAHLFVGTMEDIVSKFLTKISKEAKKQRELRDCCNEVIESINARKGGDAAGAGKGGQDASNADKYFEPFRLACKSKHARVTEIALDCLEKLVAYGYLQGTLQIECPGEGGKGVVQKLMIDDIVQNICEANENCNDESVQLQVIKALLTAVTCSTCEVHEASLLLAVRTCYSIHLVSKSTVNRTTAKATLTQMLNIVFQRMEQHDQKLGVAAMLEQPAPSSAAPSTNEAAGGEATDAVASSSTAALAEGSEKPGPTDEKPGSDEQPASGEEDGGNGEKSKTDGVDDGEAAPSDVSSAENPPPSDVASDAGTESTSASQSGEDAAAAANPPAAVAAAVAPPAAANGGAAMDFPSILHKDCFLLFRSLCKLSMKGLPDDPAHQIDTVAVQSKILSLELILSILENSGASFRTGDKFIYLIRTYLCQSLLKNCISNITQVTC